MALKQHWHNLQVTISMMTVHGTVGEGGERGEGGGRGGEGGGDASRKFRYIATRKT